MPTPNVHVAATPKKQKHLFASSYSELFDASTECLAPTENGDLRQLSSSEVMAMSPPRRQSRPQSQLFSDCDGGVVLVTPRRSLFAELKHLAVQQPKAQPHSVPVFETPQKKPPATLGFWSPCGGVVLAEVTPLKIPHTPLNVGRKITEQTQRKVKKNLMDSFEENADPGGTSIYDALGWNDDALYLE